MVLRILLSLFGLLLMLTCFAAAWLVWTRDPAWPFPAPRPAPASPPSPAERAAPLIEPQAAPAPAAEPGTEIIDLMGGAVLLSGPQPSAPADADHTMILSDMRGPTLPGQADAPQAPAARPQTAPFPSGAPRRPGHPPHFPHS